MSTLASVQLYGLYAALPAAGITGRIYNCSNSSGPHKGEVLRDNGVSWDSLGNFSVGASGNVTTGVTLTANKPVLGNGSADIIVGTTSGNTTEVATSTGAKTTGHIATWDASGNLQDGGAVPTGAMVQLAQTILGSPAATVTFSAISGAYSNLILTIAARSARSATTDDVYCAINTDATSGNYKGQVMDSFGTGNATAFPQAASIKGAYLGTIPGDTAVAGAVGSIVAELIAYAGTTWLKGGVSRCTGMLNTTFAAANLDMAMVGINWNSTAAITRLDLTTVNSANFKTGSVFTLYGIS